MILYYYWQPIMITLPLPQLLPLLLFFVFRFTRCMCEPN